MLNVKGHDGTIRKTLKKHGLFGKIAKRKPRLSKKNIAARLSFAKLPLNIPQDLWTGWTKVEMVVIIYCTMFSKK